MGNRQPIHVPNGFIVSAGTRNGHTCRKCKNHIPCRKDGKYRIWVRTRNWVKQWSNEAPGRFLVSVNQKKIEKEFGTETAEWNWEDGGTVLLNRGKNQVEITDLTGFEGRCDAILFTSDLDKKPLNTRTALNKLRKTKSIIPVIRKNAGNYDFVVVGGGIAGCCAAISAARLGCKVALIQNRPVLGGNNSSEVRVGLSGKIAQKPYTNLGNLLDELGSVGFWNNWEANQKPESERSKQIKEILKNNPEKMIHNAGPAENYEDQKKYNLITEHDNIDLYLNTEVIDVKMKGNSIKAVIGKNIENGLEYIFHGDYFADCTGDGNLGFLAGADFRIGRESKEETGEPRAPETADSLVMGTSVQWYAEEVSEDSPFAVCNWAAQFSDSTCRPTLLGEWNWETGLDKNQITQIEEIRDYALRTIYGNWSFLKNSYKHKEKFANKKLAWVAYIGGKRESRRLLGDIILKEQDILNQVEYPDASFTTTWEIDLHYPLKIKGFKEEPFMSYCKAPKIKPYPVPYRCLYSRNIDNMFMAGRNISVTHIALGTVRVMRTGGMMGEVVGMAVSICAKKNVMPRDIYTTYFGELQQLMEKGVGKPGFPLSKYTDTH